jgi:hypothetical protein
MWNISSALTIMRMSPSLLFSPAIGIALIAAAIVVILLASNVTIIYAQPQEEEEEQQLTGQPGGIENATRTTTAGATTFQSTDDSFSVEVPEGWVIQELSDTGSELGVEVSEGLRILVQLCPEEEQQRVFPNASGGSSTDSTSNSCQGAQEEVIHIVQYPDLETGVQEDNNITTYHLQKLQEVGYSNIQIVNNTDMTVNIANPQTDETIATVPAKLVEMTYSTNVDLNETRTGYFILTATAATDPDVGTIKGYAIFYEGNSTTAAIAAETTTASSSFLPPLPPAVGQIFDSFELIAAEEVAEAIAQGESEAGADETDEGGDDGSNDDDNNDDDNAGANDDDNNDDDNAGANDDDNAGANDDDNAGANDDDNAGANDDDNAGANDDDNAGAVDGEGGRGMAERIVEETIERSIG